MAAALWNCVNSDAEVANPYLDLYGSLVKTGELICMLYRVQ
jgi:hypothetical protein